MTKHCFIAWVLNKDEVDKNINSNTPLTCLKNGIKRIEIPVGILIKNRFGTIAFRENYVVFNDNDKLDFFLGDKKLPTWIFSIIADVME